jgi:hypothetical protein
MEEEVEAAAKAAVRSAEAEREQGRRAEGPAGGASAPLESLLALPPLTDRDGHGSDRPERRWGAEGGGLQARL